MATGTQLAKTEPAIPGQPQLTGRVSALWTRARIRWAGMAGRQRKWAIGAGLMLATLALALLWYAEQPDWRTLYTNLDPDDARQMGQILAQAQIPFQPSSDGTGLMVPAAQIDKARLATAAKGGVKSGRLGFEIFDKPNWVGSEFDEQVNYQRALEGELEHTVGTLTDIESARVHLVLAHDSLFRDQQRPAKASVVLRLRHHSLAEGEPDAIRNLVASAVDGLNPDNVVLVDAGGHLPLGPKTADAIQLSAEQALEDKLISTLEPVTGAGNVRASVSLDYDRTSSDTTQEIYDPDKTVTLSVQRTEQTTGAQPVAAGIPGTASNAPNSQTLPVYPQQFSSPQSAKTESSTYGVSKTDRHVEEGPGRLRRLTAAIVVNDRLVSPASKGKSAVWQTRSAEEIRNLTALAQAAVGFDGARGDTLTVEDMSFDANHEEQSISVAAEFLHVAESSPLLVKYLTMLLGALAILAFGIRPALGHLARAQSGASIPAARELASATTAQASLQPPEPLEVSSEVQRNQQIYATVAEHMRREPAQSSRLLQSWIHSE